MTETTPPAGGTGFLPPRWVIRAAWKAHKALYRVSGGRLGLRASSTDQEGLALLSTIGRRSGQPREVMIAFFEDGDDYVTMAMNGWDPAEPAWWLNLQANPEATLTLPSGPIQIHGEGAGDRQQELWDRWRKLDKFVDKNSGHRTHGTTVVVLKPIKTTSEDPATG